MQKKPDLRQLHKDIHVYHADAVGATGYLTLPVADELELQASLGLPPGGGHGSTRVDNFSHHGIFSFKSAHSEVVGRSSKKKGSRNTLAQSVIEGLNVHNIVTCDRIVSRIAVHKPDDGGESSIIPFGSTFDNLRIGGFPLTPTLAIGIFTENDTWSKFNDWKKKYKDLAKKLQIPATEQDLPVARDTYVCTLVTDWGPLPPGVEVHGHGLWVPEFGMVYLAEYFVNIQSRRLRMIRTVLGCGSEGCYGGGNTSGGTVPWP
jgi:hypothetical protein